MPDPTDRRAFVADALELGWAIASADEGFVVLESANRWQMTGWFVAGRLGLIALFDADSGATCELRPPCAVPSPAGAASLLASGID